jgi:hypothetical protein
MYDGIWQRMVVSLIISLTHTLQKEASSNMPKADSPIPLKKSFGQTGQASRVLKPFPLACHYLRTGKWIV